MNWLRANWRPLVTAVLVLFTVSSLVSAAHYMGVADTLAEESGRQQDRIDAQGVALDLAATNSAQAERETLERRAADSLSLKVLADSVVALDERTDSLERAAQAEAAEHDGWVTIETHDAVVEALIQRVAISDSIAIVEHEGKLQEVTRGDALEVQVGVLMARVGLMARQDTIKTAEITALRNVKAPGLAIRFKADWWMAAGGFIIGMVVTR